MTIHFDPLMKMKPAIIPLDDTIMQSQNKNEMFTEINEYHTLLRKARLKAAFDRYFFPMIVEFPGYVISPIEFPGHLVSPEGIQQIAERVKDLKTLKSPASKQEVKKLLGCFGFYCCYLKNLNMESQRFYDLTKVSTPFHWTHEHDKNHSNQTKRKSMRTRFSPGFLPIIFSLSRGFIERWNWLYSNSTVDWGKTNNFPQFQNLRQAEQKISALHRDLGGIVSALQTYEQYIIGSPVPIYFFCDYKPIHYLWGRKGQFSICFFRHQVIVTKFQHLKLIWTPGSNKISQTSSVYMWR